MSVDIDLKIIALVIGLFGTAATSVGAYYVRGADIANLKATVVEQGESIHELQLKSVSDGTSLGTVREDLSEIKKDIKELLKR